MRCGGCGDSDRPRPRHSQPPCRRQRQRGSLSWESSTFVARGHAPRSWSYGARLAQASSSSSRHRGHAAASAATPRPSRVSRERPRQLADRFPTPDDVYRRRPAAGNRDHEKPPVRLPRHRPASVRHPDAPGVEAEADGAPTADRTPNPEQQPSGRPALLAAHVGAGYARPACLCCAQLILRASPEPEGLQAAEPPCPPYGASRAACKGLSALVRAVARLRGRWGKAR
jgi:hypothetical protein